MAEEPKLGERVVKIELIYLAAEGQLPDLQEGVNAFLATIPADDVVSVKMVIYTSPVIMVTYLKDVA